MQTHVLRRLHLFLAQLSQSWPRADPLTGFGPLFASSWPLSPRYDHQADGSCRACGAKGLKPLPIRHLSSAKFKWYRMISKFIDTKLFPTACIKGVLQWAHERNGNYGNTQEKITLLRVIPTMTSIRFVTGKSSGILSGTSSGILSGTSSGILPGISSAICLLAFYLAYLLQYVLAYLLALYMSGISSGILSGKSSGICSGKYSGILSGISSGIFSAQIFWHSIWQTFWHFIWHNFWQSIWHSIWHTFWHSIWHIFWHMF